MTEQSFKEQFPDLDPCEFKINRRKTNYKYLGDGSRVKLFRDREIGLYCLEKQQINMKRARIMMNKIQKGLEDIKNGRVKPWSETKFKLLQQEVKELKEKIDEVYNFYKNHLDRCHKK